MTTRSGPSPTTAVETRTVVEKIVRYFLGNDQDDSFKAAVVMVAAKFEGPDVDRIAKLTRYSITYVGQIAARMKASAMWDDKQVHYQEWDRTTNLGCICFFMDLGVAEGLLFRTGEKRNGKYVYASLERKTLN